MKFGVMGIPTLIAFKRGQVVGKVVGAAPKDQLRAWIEKHL
jgi:thioredoxin 1